MARGFITVPRSFSKNIHLSFIGFDKQERYNFEYRRFLHFNQNLMAFQGQPIMVYHVSDLRGFFKKPDTKERSEFIQTGFIGPDTYMRLLFSEGRLTFLYDVQNVRSFKIVRTSRDDTLVKEIIQPSRSSFCIKGESPNEVYNALKGRGNLKLYMGETEVGKGLQKAFGNSAEYSRRTLF